MAIKAAVVAQEIQNLIRMHKVDVLTFTWVDFYKIAGRERVKDAFTVELSAQLRTLGLLISYGNAVVLVGKDFQFAPVKV
jgi:hypothetical protein